MTPETAGRFIWKGKLGEYPIPMSVLSEAQALTPNVRWTDQRTKAYKFVKEWGENQDRAKKIYLDGIIKPSWFERLLSWVGL